MAKEANHAAQVIEYDRGRHAIVFRQEERKRKKKGDERNREKQKNVVRKAPEHFAAIVVGGPWFAETSYKGTQTAHHPLAYALRKLASSAHVREAKRRGKGGNLLTLKILRRSKEKGCEVMKTNALIVILPSIVRGQRTLTVSREER